MPQHTKKTQQRAGKVEYVLAILSSNSLSLLRDYMAGKPLSWRLQYYQASEDMGGGFGLGIYDPNPEKAKRFPTIRGQRTNGTERFVKLVGGKPVDAEERMAELVAIRMVGLEKQATMRREREAARVAAR